MAFFEIWRKLHGSWNPYTARRCDAAGLNASEFFVFKSRTIHTVCIVSTCACVARCTLVERA